MTHLALPGLLCLNGINPAGCDCCSCSGWDHVSLDIHISCNYPYYDAHGDEIRFCSPLVRRDHRELFRTFQTPQLFAPFWRGMTSGSDKKLLSRLSDGSTAGA
ncbi:hypothetical protein BX600DRAFT_449145 [Xylariales sp. PMI_506]|nr:hypothetical protein BX600DRAFT_449145 [Xylariales sp. PMI_506]